jgi:prepilin-type processing-associated H-X9-DG protein
VTPSWAISDGNLYLGLYPQVVIAAADQVKHNGPSILDRPEYQAVMKQLGDHPANALSFCNLPDTAADSYTDVLMISRLYLGIADVFGVHPPAMMVPPLGKITPELSPSGAISWTDSMGLHARSITPFPGADMVAGANLGSSIVLGEGAMMTSIMLPALSKARGQANRVKSMSNERQLGLGMMLYANDNQGKLPDDLGTLFKAEQLSGSVFICPTGSTTLPPNFDAMTPDDKAKWINDNSDYVYLGKGQKINNPGGPNRILLYEKDGAHEADGINLLFGDGHVEFRRADNAQKMIQQQEGGM